MLTELNVKDIALIRSVSVELGPGLNILTGETGTGKSVIIGSAMLALGGKVKGDIIRKGAEYGLVELIFVPDNDRERALIRESGFEPEDGQLIISRRIYPGRSVSRVNGETVTLSALRELCSRLIDIYGQNEHQSLLSDKEHLRILDGFAGDSISSLKAETEAAYDAYKRAKAEAESFDLDEGERLREAELCEFEINEIETADVREGEEEELARLYKKLSNARTVVESLGRAASALRETGISEALEHIREASRYDTELSSVYDELSDADSIASTVLSEIDDYVEETELDGQRLDETEERLELIRRLGQKYGEGAARINAYKAKRQERLLILRDYEESKKRAEEKEAQTRDRLYKACEALSRERKRNAELLCREVQRELSELNFSSVSFDMEFREKEPSRDGYDNVGFVAALNPGEEPKPLSEAASGGELSRIMLAIKTVLADTDDIPTLIFDEIDTGISGRTAQRVSEKLNRIAASRQVICITHLPQIAAMADLHYLISKSEEEGRNVTTIERLSEEESINELARLLSGAVVTKSVYENAREMKKLAAELKASEKLKA